MSTTSQAYSDWRNAYAGTTDALLWAELRGTHSEERHGGNPARPDERVWGLRRDALRLMRAAGRLTAAQLATGEAMRDDRDRCEGLRASAPIGTPRGGGGGNGAEAWMLARAGAAGRLRGAALACGDSRYARLALIFIVLNDGTCDGLSRILHVRPTTVASALRDGLDAAEPLYASLPRRP
jgi:hypothetical protein